MKLYNKEELKDSRIFFDKQPPKYLFVLNWFLVTLLVASLIGANFVMKNYIVKAQGTIEADDKLYVTPAASGNIAKIHKKEGEQVKKGDVLLTLSVGTEGVQESEIQKQIDDLEAKKEIYDKYEKSLKEKTNYLKNSGNEQAYYGKVAYYLEQVQGEGTESEQTVEIINQKQVDLEKLQEELETIKQKNQEKYQKDLTRKQSQLEKLQKELQKLQDKEDSNGLLEAEKQSKESELDSLQIEIEDLKRLSNEKLKSELDAKESQLEKLQKELQELQDKEDSDGLLEAEKQSKELEIDSLQMEIEDLKGISDEQLKSELDAKESEIKGLKQEIKDLERQGETAPASNSTYNQLISELGTERIQTNDKIAELESQYSVNSANSNALTITAHKDGYLHYLMPIKVGIGLQSFQPVAQIANDEEAELFVESYIPAQDISKVNVNDFVKISIVGVNQTKFGVLKGKVKEISNGTITQQGENNSQVMLYQVTVALKTKELKNGEEIIKARASMPVTANIVYENESYLEWLMEQLNFTK